MNKIMGRTVPFPSLPNPGPRPGSGPSHLLTVLLLSVTLFVVMGTEWSSSSLLSEES